MMYSIRTIASIISGTLISPENEDRQITELIFDSRKVVRKDRALFFALQGKRRNGHDFIPSAYADGFRAFVVEPAFDTRAFPLASFIQVPDVLNALQGLAIHHRSQFREIPIIGITGSNGKTVVKEWLDQTLSDQYLIVKSPKSYNSQIGVPISVWQLKEFHQLAIFEAGISRKGEMDNLKNIIQPTIGIFTNLGTAHDQGFADHEEKLEEKFKLFKSLEVLVYCRDQETIYRKVIEKKIPNWSWGYHSEADVQVISRKNVLSGQKRFQEIQIHFRGDQEVFLLPFGDDASFENAMQVVATTLYLNSTQNPPKASFRDIAKKLEGLEPLALRMELKPAKNGSVLIDDSYSNDLDALTNALAFMEQQEGNEERVLILSDILETGRSREELYESVANLLGSKQVHHILGVGQDIQLLKPFLSTEIEANWFEKTTDLIDFLKKNPIKQSIILIKGARSFGFEKVANWLSGKMHRTVLEIDLEAMRHNLECYADLIRPSTKIMVMVKASAYGSGDQAVARMLEYHGVDYLAVAYIDEGIRLRKQGVQLPIMVLNPEPTGFPALVEYRLEPEIFSLSQLKLLVETLNDLDPPNQFPIHLKIETGMHRLGFDESQIPELIQYLNAQKRCTVCSLFSHLSASEDPSEDKFTKQQIQLFERLSEGIQGQLDYPVLRHILNSSGIARFPEYQFDMVRLGIGLYGVEDAPILRKELLPVFSLKTYITQIKTVEAGASIGYGRAGKAEKSMRLATVSIGYADGFWRRLSQGKGRLYWNGQPAEVVGNVCMDMTMIDISHLPEAREGDPLIVFGAEADIRTFAEDAETIPYEILTAISARVPRVYLQD